MIKTIIIDDNNVVVNNLMSHFNANSSIKVVATFTNGESALDYLTQNSHNVDLILMDILIPGLDGIALLEELKQRGINKKIIVLSSYKDENIIRQCSEYSVSYYIISNSILHLKLC